MRVSASRDRRHGSATSVARATSAKSSARAIAASGVVKSTRQNAGPWLLVMYAKLQLAQLATPVSEYHSFVSFLGEGQRRLPTTPPRKTSTITNAFAFESATAA